MLGICMEYCEELGLPVQVDSRSGRAWLWPLLWSLRGIVELVSWGPKGTLAWRRMMTFIHVAFAVQSKMSSLSCHASSQQSLYFHMGHQLRWIFCRSKNAEQRMHRACTCLIMATFWQFLWCSVRSMKCSVFCIALSIVCLHLGRGVGRSSERRLGKPWNSRRRRGSWFRIHPGKQSWI